MTQVINYTQQTLPELVINAATNMLNFWLNVLCIQSRVFGLPNENFQSMYNCSKIFTGMKSL